MPITPSGWYITRALAGQNCHPTAAWRGSIQRFKLLSA